MGFDFHLLLHLRLNDCLIPLYIVQCSVYVPKTIKFSFKFINFHCHLDILTCTLFTSWDILLIMECQKGPRVEQQQYFPSILLSSGQLNMKLLVFVNQYTPGTSKFLKLKQSCLLLEICQNGVWQLSRFWIMVKCAEATSSTDNWILRILSGLKIITRCQICQNK